MRIARAWSLMVSLALLLAAPAGAEEVTREFSHEFDTAGARLLRVQHGDGDVEILPSEGSTVTVSVIYRVEVKRMGWGTPPDLDVDFGEDDGVLSVVGHEKGTVNVGVLIESQEEYRYTITAPPTLAVETEGEDGDVHLSGRRSAVTCRLEDGNLELDDCREGDVVIRISDGNVGIDGIEGNLDLESEDGRVEIQGAELSRGRFVMEDGNLDLEGRVDDLEARIEDGSLLLDPLQTTKASLRTEDGDIHVRLAAASGIDLEARSEDGGVELVLPRQLSAAYEVQSAGGLVELEIPGSETVRREQGKVTGSMGDGKGRILVVTEDGDVSLRTESSR